MRTLLVTASIIALAAATPAIAGDAATKTKSQQQQAQSTTQSSETTQSAATIRASDLMNVAIVNDKNETIGDVNDVVVDQAGNIERVIVGVGGFLGMGERNVAIKFDKLSIGKKPDGALKITTPLTRKELEQMPTHQKQS